MITKVLIWTTNNSMNQIIDSVIEEEKVKLYLNYQFE